MPDEEDLELLREGAEADGWLPDRDDPTRAPEEREDDLAGADLTAGCDLWVLLFDTFGDSLLGADCRTEGLDVLPEIVAEGLCEERSLTAGADDGLLGAGEADLLRYDSVLLPTEVPGAVRAGEEDSDLRVTVDEFPVEGFLSLRPVAIVPDLRSTPVLRLTELPEEVLPETPVEDLRVALFCTSAPDRVAFLPVVTEDDLRVADVPEFTDDLCPEVVPDDLTLADLVSKELRPLFDLAYNRSPTFLVSGRE